MRAGAKIRAIALSITGLTQKAREHWTNLPRLTDPGSIGRLSEERASTLLDMVRTPNWNATPEWAWSEAAHQADWVGEALSPFGDHVVTSVVPGGFDAYARVLHPAEVPHADFGRVVRWREVAEWSGTTLGRNTQFHSIALPEERPGLEAPWQGQGPALGRLLPADAMVLAEVISAWTTSPERCWFCLWDGYGWENARLLTPVGEPAVRLPDPIPENVRQGRRVRLPKRDYLLYTGPLEAVLASVPLSDQEQTPNLWWPEDRSWFVGSEIDLAWTYVGGPADMIEALLTEARIEALPAEPDDPLTRVEGWVERWVDEATDRLLADGEATIVTSRGTLYARLKRPKRGRRGSLQIRSVGDNGVNGSGTNYLRRQDEQQLRKEIVFYLTGRVIALVGG